DLSNTSTLAGAHARKSEHQAAGQDRDAHSFYSIVRQRIRIGARVPRRGPLLAVSLGHRQKCLCYSKCVNKLFNDSASVGCAKTPSRKAVNGNLPIMAS